MAKKKGEVSTFEPKNTKSGKKRPTASGLIALAVIVLVIAYFVVSGIKIIKLNQEKEEAEAQLEEKMDRWVYLNDLAEKIEKQNQK